MCGIAGIWNRDGCPVDRGLLTGMRRALRHRGPDAAGLMTDGGVGLAHCRLSILDLSDRADQPVSTDDGAYSLSFNGEIHNYLEIRTELEQLGHRFHSTGDSEVVLQAFRQWGCDCFPRFNGMWALGIWDRRERRVVLSRDRFGLKPLFYSLRGSRLVFASEIKGILAALPEEAVVDESELAAYLLCANPDSDAATFYRNIRAIPPATFLIVGRNDVEGPRGYWDFEPGSLQIPTRPAEEFRELLEDAVRLRLRSDTPVGACVSGGLDSSSIAVLAKDLTDQPIHCFSLRFDEYPSVDESGYASAVLDASDRFITHWVRPKPTGLLDTLSKIVRANDAPSPIRGRLGMWEIFREARKEVKVVLIGEGGDELLAGYRRFSVPYAIDLFRLGSGENGRVVSSAAQLLALVLRTWSLRPGMLLELARPFVRPYRLYSRADAAALGKDFARLARPPEPVRFLHTFLRRDVPRPFESALNNALWQEFRHSGIPELVRAEDALSMAFSLETRAPFLDHRLVEFCFRLPHFEKIADGWTKSLLRRAMQGALPERIRLRRDKVGMPTPYLSYLREPANLRPMREMLLDGQAVSRGILNRPVLERYLKQLQERAPGHGLRLSALWHYICTEIWLGQLAEYALRGR